MKKKQKAETILLHEKYLLEQDRNLERLQSYIDDVPKLLADCKQTVPGQIAKLKDGYGEMKEKGYKLEHIQLDKELENLSNQLKRAEHVLMTDLDIDEASAILRLIDENIQSVYQRDWRAKLKPVNPY